MLLGQETGAVAVGWVAEAGDRGRVVDTTVRWDKVAGSDADGVAGPAGVGPGDVGSAVGDGCRTAATGAPVAVPGTAVAAEVAASEGALRAYRTTANTMTTPVTAKPLSAASGNRGRTPPSRASASVALVGIAAGVGFGVCPADSVT
jgi:hypothetical protein